MVTEDGWTEEVQRMFAAFVIDKALLPQFVSADEIGDGDTLVPCYGVHHLEICVCPSAPAPIGR